MSKNCYRWRSFTVNATNPVHRGTTSLLLSIMGKQKQQLLLKCFSMEKIDQLLKMPKRVWLEHMRCLIKTTPYSARIIDSNIDQTDPKQLVLVVEKLGPSLKDLLLLTQSSRKSESVLLSQAILVIEYFLRSDLPCCSLGPEVLFMNSQHTRILLNTISLKFTGFERKSLSTHTQQSNEQRRRFQQQSLRWSIVRTLYCIATWSYLPEHEKVTVQMLGNVKDSDLKYLLGILISDKFNRNKGIKWMLAERPPNVDNLDLSLRQRQLSQALREFRQVHIPSIWQGVLEEWDCNQNQLADMYAHVIFNQCLPHLGQQQPNSFPRQSEQDAQENASQVTTNTGKSKVTSTTACSRTQLSRQWKTTADNITSQLDALAERQFEHCNKMFGLSPRLKKICLAYRFYEQLIERVCDYSAPLVLSFEYLKRCTETIPDWFHYTPN